MGNSARRRSALERQGAGRGRCPLRPALPVLPTRSLSAATSGCAPALWSLLPAVGCPWTSILFALCCAGTTTRNPETQPNPHPAFPGDIAQFHKRNRQTAKCALDIHCHAIRLLLSGVSAPLMNADAAVRSSLLATASRAKSARNRVGPQRRGTSMNMSEAAHVPSRC
jgi:hypothetical protein